jgi:hypothetical protein
MEKPRNGELWWIYVEKKKTAPKRKGDTQKTRETVSGGPERLPGEATQ